MTCKKCGSNNVNVQVINEVYLKKQHHSLMWWLCIGWWLELILWALLFGYKLFITLVRIATGGKKKTVNKQKTIAVCQNCGHKWNV